MTSVHGPAHVVVDGSNIATEGRSLPSLAQLNEAVMSFMEEHPNTAITVVVDATFGHRIDKKEAKEFEEGISNNELVAPPAGAVGRGDAFVLGIAQKANASILSNDSFQEFHAEYGWLFDEGRLIGGKPVPHVGWVFVDRVPVRGPVSRKATGGKGSSRRSGRADSGDRGSRSGRKVSAAASEPMPVPTSPPPGRSGKQADEPAAQPAPSENAAVRQSAPRAGETVNDLMPFLEFVEHHPVGTSVNGTVDSYSSHGAYVTIGDENVRGYVPLRLMADPPPPSARKVMRLGESVTLVVVSFAPLRRSIDCAMPDLAARAIVDAQTETAADSSDGAASDRPTKKSPTRKAAAKKSPAKQSAAKKSPTARTAARKTAAPSTSAEQVPATAVDQVRATKGAATKGAATKAPAKRATARKASATKSPEGQPVEQNQATTAPVGKSPARKAPVKQVAAKKAPAKKTPAKQVTAKTTPAKKGPAKKVAAKKAPAKKVAARKAPVKQVAAKKSSAKKAPAKKSAATPHVEATIEG